MKSMNSILRDYELLSGVHINERKFRYETRLTTEPSARDHGQRIDLYEGRMS